MHNCIKKHTQNIRFVEPWTLWTIGSGYPWCTVIKCGTSVHIRRAVVRRPEESRPTHAPATRRPVRSAGHGESGESPGAVSRTPCVTARPAGPPAAGESGPAARDASRLTRERIDRTVSWLCGMRELCRHWTGCLHGTIWRNRVVGWFRAPFFFFNWRGAWIFRVESHKQNSSEKRWNTFWVSDRVFSLIFGRLNVSTYTRTWLVAVVLLMSILLVSCIDRNFIFVFLTFLLLHI